jgi:pyruvate dehydrogenase E1 component alpha subunit
MAPRPALSLRKFLFSRSLATSTASTRVTPLPPTFGVTDISQFIGSDAEKVYSFEVSPYDTYQCESPTTTVTASKKELLEMYYNMVVIRRMEMASDALYKAKLIRGFCHLSTGQVSIVKAMILTWPQPILIGSCCCWIRSCN